MRIFKYTLSVADLQTLMLPARAQILDVQAQYSEAQLWALVDELETAREPRVIAVYGTGNPMPENCGSYIATFQMYNGQLVFHAFEVTK